MAGRAASNVLVRYAGVQVQTSSMGVQIPVGWGTFRCKCNLVDYLDFTSKAQKAGGKGGAQTTGYSYSATIILALCEGTIDAVTAVFVDGKFYVHGSTYSTMPDTGSASAMSQANLNLATGAIGQAVWSYLTSNHPTHAIGYSGLALAYQSHYALDSGASPPNHSFEVVRTTGFGVSGTPDADPSLVIADFFQNTRYGVPGWPASGLLGSLVQYQDYCLAAGLLVSPIIDSQRSASDFVTEMLRATNSTCCWSEGVLKFYPYGDTTLTGNGKTYTPVTTAVYSITDDDYTPASEADDPVLIDIEDQSNAYNIVQLEYLDRTNQYNMAIALASDAANVAQYGERRKDPDTVHVICTPSAAAVSAQLFLQRTLYVRQQFRFSLPWSFALLEPGDLVELTDAGLGLAAYPVRIIQIDDDEDGARDVIAEDYLGGVGNTPEYTMQVGAGAALNVGVDPGGVEANLMLWSDDPTNAVYSKSSLTLTGAATTDQYGLMTAAVLMPSVATAQHSISQVMSVFGDLAYTYSACLQKNVHKNARVELLDQTGSNGGYIEVDTNAGVILTPGTAVGTGVVVAATMLPTLVAGIWQVNLTVRVPAATTLAASVSVLSDAGALVWLGDGSAALNLSQQALRQGIVPGVYCATQASFASPLIFNPPAVLTQNSGGSTAWAAVAGGPNWGGCNVWTSIDGTNYDPAGTLTGGSRYGVLTASFASHADPDTADTLAVDLGVSGASILGASAASADNGATLSLVDNEVVSFETATLTNPSRYNIGTYIRRGFLNSPIGAHSAGAPFVRLDDGIFDFPYLAVNIGQTVYAKFQSFNLYGQNPVSLADCIAYSVVPRPSPAVAPVAASWTCAGTTVANAGTAVPAIQITGACENASASAVIFYYRVSGTAPWSSAAAHSALTTLYDIAPLASGQSYDIAVSYVINGVETVKTVIGASIVAGMLNPGTSSSTVADGTVLFDSSIPGSWSFPIPSTGLPHVWIERWGADGGPVYRIIHETGAPDSYIDKESAGSGGYVKDYESCTPGSTTFGGIIGTAGTPEPVASAPGTNGTATTCIGLSSVAGGGTGATATGAGAGGSASGGNVTSIAGTTGAVPNSIGPNNGRVRITAKT